jgi:Tol biopolymer transport system component
MVFVSDLLHGTTTVANIDTNGVADTNGYSIDPAISANGRYIAFTSSARDLVSNSVANGANIYVRDLQLGTTVLASLNIPSVDLGNYSPMIDASGRHVAYFNNSNGVASLFYTDLQSNVTVEVSQNTGSNVVTSAMTPDGRYVAFAGQPELWDSQTGTIAYKATAYSVSNIAVSPDGNRLAYVANRVLYGVDRAGGSNWIIAANAFAPNAKLQFSGDSRYLVYVSTAAITPNDTNSLEDVYRYDFQANTNLLISQSTAGSIANGPSDSPTISWDGRFIAYRSFASNLVAASANGFPQIYLYDNQTGATTLASASAFTGGPGNNRSLAPIFSGDSTTLVFQSWASDLLTNDFGGGGIYALSVAVSPPALIGAIQISPAGVPVISWPANAGTNLQLQYKDNLTDPSWLPLSGGITIVSNTGSISDSSPNPQQRFYRVHSN